MWVEQMLLLYLRHCQLLLNRHAQQLKNTL
jgi:hypothetical protein